MFVCIIACTLLTSTKQCKMYKLTSTGSCFSFGSFDKYSCHLLGPKISTKGSSPTVLEQYNMQDVPGGIMKTIMYFHS